MLGITQGQAKRFALGAVLASIGYLVIVWVIYDGPLIRMVPGMVAIAVIIGLFAVWSPPRKIGTPPP